jgi:hypothetical protein
MAPPASGQVTPELEALVIQHAPLAKSIAARDGDPDRHLHLRGRHQDGRHEDAVVEPGAPFGAVVYPAPGADDWERLAAFMGRDPRTTPGL